MDYSKSTMKEGNASRHCAAVISFYSHLSSHGCSSGAEPGVFQQQFCLVCVGTVLRGAVVCPFEYNVWSAGVSVYDCD